MVLAPDHNAGTSARVPLVLAGMGPVLNGDNNGPNVATEIYDPDSGWKDYEVLEYSTWTTFGCLTSYNDDVYAITPGGVVALHTASWSYDEYGGETPEFLLPVTKCSPVVIDGQLGTLFLIAMFCILKFPPEIINILEQNEKSDYFVFQESCFGTVIGSI